MPALRATERRAGPRIHLITFLAVSSATQDGTGATVDAPTEMCKQWASITPLTGGESWIPPQLSGTRSYEIICDFFVGLTSKHRIQYGTRTFDIVLVRDLEERGIQYAILANEAV